MGYAEGRACLSEERQSEVRQINLVGHAEECACLLEEQQREIRQTNRTEHADGRARLSEKRHAERRVHCDMGIIHKEKDSYDNYHRRDFSVIQDTRRLL